MNKYNVVMEMNDSTVVTEYKPVKGEIKIGCKSVSQDSVH